MTKSKKLNILKLIGGISLVAIPAVVVPSVMLTSCSESAISVKSKFATADCSTATATSEIKLTAKDAIDAKTQGTFTVKTATIDGKDVLASKGISFNAAVWGADNVATITATLTSATIATTIGNTTANAEKTAKVTIEYTPKSVDGKPTSITVDLKITKLPAKI